MKKYFIILLAILSFSCRKEKTPNDHIGFPVSDLEGHSFDAGLFSEYMTFLDSGFYGNINSIIVIHDNELIQEKYFKNWGRNDLIQIQSSTKSIASLMIGLAIEQGYLSLDDKLPSFFNEYEILNLDSLKTSITIEDMLSMTTGLKWDESSSAYGTPENSLTQMSTSTENFIPYLLNLPMADFPGEKFVYNSGVSYLLGAIIEAATGKQVENYCTNNLLQPLGIPTSDWVAYNDGGLAHCGGGLFLRPIDMAKIGTLILNKGKWEGTQILSESWIKESVESRVEVGGIVEYGYQWWIYNTPLDIHEIYSARGYGWRNINIIPSLNMVVVTTGNNTTNETTFNEIQMLFDILSCSPKFKSKILGLYEDQVNNPGTKLLSDADIVSLAKYLNRYKEYDKTIRYLELFEHDNNIDYEFHYTYHLGNAYYQSGNYNMAKMYLEEHLKFDERNTLYTKYYYQRTKEMLDAINNKSM